MDPLVLLLLTVVLIFAIGGLFIYLVDWAGIPAPMNKIAKIIIVLIVLIIVIQRIGLLHYGSMY